MLICPCSDETECAPVLRSAGTHQSRNLHFAQGGRNAVEILD